MVRETMTPSIVRLGAHRIVERQCRFAVSLTANSCANRAILEGRTKCVGVVTCVSVVNKKVTCFVRKKCIFGC